MNKTGIIFWITGLSGAGKTVHSNFLAEYLGQLNRPCVILDGDELREAMGIGTAYTRDERIKIGLQYAKMCKLISRQGIDVIIATIALYDAIHRWKHENLKNCCTIFIDVPLEELRRRDPKQIYTRYDEKKISNVTGLDVKADFPTDPEIHIKWTSALDIEKSRLCLYDRVNEYLTKNC